ncbi:Uncharacterized protein TCM_014168 [Theobroma cacao]|uniref:HAT C-terminal dimerisation domain-containing protein n=1 Tax=Theobroma cacao TaxID=3641 RepID=A0A061FYP3_THECC|nr:Uncharacterized protein TCM_014168 [Theobroma cacao]
MSETPLVLSRQLKRIFGEEDFSAQFLDLKISIPQFIKWAKDCTSKLDLSKMRLKISMASQSHNLALTPSHAVTPTSMSSSSPSPTTQQIAISTNESKAVCSKKRKSTSTERCKITIGEEKDKSELERYLSLNEPNAINSDNFDVLIWRKLNNHRYPTLALLTYHVLAIPPSIVASKLVFSIGGCVLDAKSSLTLKMMQAFICTQD